MDKYDLAKPNAETFVPSPPPSPFIHSEWKGDRGKGEFDILDETAGSVPKPPTFDTLEAAQAEIARLREVVEERQNVVQNQLREMDKLRRAWREATDGTELRKLRGQVRRLRNQIATARECIMDEVQKRLDITNEPVV